MVDFSYLQKEEAKKDESIPYVIHDLEGKPILKVKPALPEYNKQFKKEVLRIAENKRRMKKSKKDDGSLDFELYAKTVITGWDGVFDSNGNKVEFSSENCLSYLKAIPCFVFSDIKIFTLDISNWVESVDTEEAAKNSESA